jgi:hypothetical protein
MFQGQIPSKSMIIKFLFYLILDRAVSQSDAAKF